MIVIGVERSTTLFFGALAYPTVLDTRRLSGDNERYVALGYTMIPTPPSPYYSLVLGGVATFPPPPLGFTYVRGNRLSISLYTGALTLLAPRSYMWYTAPRLLAEAVDHKPFSAVGAPQLTLTGRPRTPDLVTFLTQSRPLILRLVARWASIMSESRHSYHKYTIVPHVSAVVQYGVVPIRIEVLQ